MEVLLRNSSIEGSVILLADVDVKRKNFTQTRRSDYSKVYKDIVETGSICAQARLEKGDKWATVKRAAHLQLPIRGVRLLRG